MTTAPAAPPASPARRRALDAALALFVRRGVLATTIEDVRAASGVAVGTLYHHFGDKQGLVGATYADVLGRYQDAFLAELHGHEDPREAIGAIVRFHLDWCARHRDQARFLLGHRAAVDGHAALAERNRAFLGEVRRWWRAHARYGALADLELDLVNALWLGPAQELSRLALDGRSPAPSAADAGVLVAAAQQALCPDSPRS